MTRKHTERGPEKHLGLVSSCKSRYASSRVDFQAKSGNLEQTIRPIYVPRLQMPEHCLLALGNLELETWNLEYNNLSSTLTFVSKTKGRVVDLFSSLSSRH